MGRPVMEEKKRLKRRGITEPAGRFPPLHYWDPKGTVPRR